MLRTLRERRADREEGFTLIELLVAMLIIGMLAAVAISAFLNQRGKAQDLGAKSMAHTAQVAMEALGSNRTGSYSTASPANLKAIEGTILTAAGSPARPYASAASGTATSWTLTIRSPSGNSYLIARNSAGALSYTCTVPAGKPRGGCPSTGKWG
jgi:type IV pilus assembly protein PilA